MQFEVDTRGGCACIPRPGWLPALLPAIALLACTGTVGRSGSGAGPGHTPDRHGGEGATEPKGVEACGNEFLLPARTVRLSSEELEKHLRASLGLGPGELDAKASFHLQGGHLDVADERAISDADLVSLRVAAASMAAAFVARLQAGHPCRTGDQDACRNETLRPVLERLFRRPALAEEWQLWADAHANMAGPHGAARALEGTIVAAALAPQTLFRIEAADRKAVPPGSAVRLSRGEAMDLLSFALRGLPAGADGDAAVETPDEPAVAADLQRLAVDWTTGDPFAQRLLDVTEHLFGVADLDVAQREESVFDATLKGAMREQFRTFVRETLLDESAGFAAMLEDLDVPYDERLAPLFEGDTPHAQINGDRMILDGRHRRGIFALPALLAANATPAASDPVKRGILVRQHLLCEPMPPPDPNADFSKIEQSPDMQTRERFEALARAPACSGCHEVINPPGYLFEHFDQYGRFRDQEKGKPIDASGSITPFFQDPPYEGVEDWDGVAPLATWLAQSPRARRCFAMRFAGYVLSAPIPQGLDNCLLDQVASRFVTSGRLTDLAADLVGSDLFLMRTATREGSR